LTSQVDLHLHTTASDGVYAPSAVVALARARGLQTIAITDHDSVAGVAEALAVAGHELEVIPGVEINTDVPHSEVHILGYYLDDHHAELQDVLQKLQDFRRDRARRMVEKLARLGLPLDWERVASLAGDGAVGRPHVAQALVERGYMADVSQAFDRYIGREGPAYVERYRLAPTEATRLIVRAGGLPVLAHPIGLENLPSLLDELTAAGLVGLEAYYTGYLPEETQSLLALAQKYGLVATGGSDFHGGGILPHADLGAVFVPMEAVAALRARLAGGRGAVADYSCRTGC
jgi:predicted metal-dependent phosphoesterase TrpH